MTYNEIFQNRNILMNIPLAYEGRVLPKSTAASVMLLRVKYQQHVDEFIKTIQEVQKGLKKDGYDERVSAYSRMTSIFDKKKKAEEWKEGDEGEKPEMPTQEEIDEANKTKETAEEFEKERKELEEATMEAQDKEGKKEVNFKDCKLTKEELADIYEVIGVEGNFSYSVVGQDNNIEVPREWLLSMIALHLV